MIESLEILQNNVKIDGVDKFLSEEYPDLKDELIKDFRRDKIENTQEIESLKEEINNLNETLNQIENIQKISEIQEVIANIEFQSLNIIEETINLIVDLFQKIGVDVDKIHFESLNKLELKISQLNKNVQELKNKEHYLLNNLENDTVSLTSLDREQKAIDKKIEFVEDSKIINSIDPLEKEYKLTSEDKEVLFQAEKEIYEKLNKFNLHDLENQKLILGLNNSLIDIKHELQKEFEDIDFDYLEILKNGVIGGSIGAGIGGPLGAITGFIGGIGGEIAKESAIHLGANETVAGGLQVGIDFLSGAGIGKMVLRNLPETFLKDLLLKIEYMSKGILNDLREYEFIDKYGKVIFKGKIKDIIGEETIKMPYIGSNIEKANAAGYLRDANYFGKEFLKKYPEMLSEENKARILAGKSPIVDEVWLKYHPNQKAFLGERLEHHHINNVGEAAYVPQSLHRGKVNKDILHVDNDNFFDSLKETIKQKTR